MTCGFAAGGVGPEGRGKGNRKRIVSEEKDKAKRSIWRFRGRKMATGLNVTVSVILAAAVLILVNCLARRYYWRRDVSIHRYYSLSPKTKQMLGRLHADLEAVSFFQKSHELFDDIANLLEEYEYEAFRNEDLSFKVRIVDPDRDLAEAARLAREYGVTRANIVVFRSGGRRICLEAKDIDEYQAVLTESGARKQRVAFGGERAFSSAILSLVETRKPVVYFLSGHGEHRIKDYGRQSGYSRIAKVVQRDNMETKELIISREQGIPDDCAALVIAGPDKPIPRFELDLVSRYLDNNGRVLLMIDPATTTGLEGLLTRWGLNLSQDVVVDPSLTHTGTELVVTRYGEHDLAKGMTGVQTAFYMPRSIQPIAGSHASDRPHVTVLVENSDKGWAEMDLNQSPAKFDAKVDRRGPVPVAVVVERGSTEDIELGVKPTCMVVIGDSSFVSNGWLQRGHGNESFFMCALNWLVEREALIAVGPKPTQILQLDMNRDQMRTALLVTVFAIPGMVAILGALVWVRRRR